MTMTSRLAKYYLYERTINRMRRWAGLFPDSIMTVDSRLITWAHVACLLVVTWGLANFCYHYRLRRDIFMKGLNWILALSSVFLKTSMLNVHRQRLTDLDIGLSLAFNRDLGNSEFRPILLSSFHWFYRPSIVLAFSTWMTLAMSVARPFLVVIIQRIRGAKVITYVRPFVAIYPWKTDPRTWRYPVTFAFELYVAFCCAVLGSLADVLFGYYVFQMCGQLRTLSHRARNLRKSSNYVQDLRQCSGQYQTLARCRGHLDRIWGPIVLWITIANAVIICGLLYRMVHKRTDLVTVVYITMKASQTLIYGWFGTSLTTESENFREAIYASDWPGSGEKRLMNDIFVMLMYKPFVLSTCGLTNISVDMFLNVSNTALSYYFMMRALDE